MRSCHLLLLAFCTAMLTGCDSPKRTVEKLEKQISEFKAAPDDIKQKAIEESFAKLSAQITELEKKGATAEAAEMKRNAAALQGEYQAAKIARVVYDAKHAIDGISEAFKSGAESLKDSLKGTNANK